MVETSERRNIYDDETKIMTLCYEHHNWIHGKSYKEKVNHSRLIKLGIDKAKKRGVKLGRKRVYDDNTIKEILSLKEQGMSIRKIATVLSINRGVVQRTFRI